MTGAVSYNSYQFTCINHFLLAICVWIQIWKWDLLCLTWLSIQACGWFVKVVFCCWTVDFFVKHSGQIFRRRLFFIIDCVESGQKVQQVSGLEVPACSCCQHAAEVLGGGSVTVSQIVGCPMLQWTLLPFGVWFLLLSERCLLLFLVILCLSGRSLEDTGLAGTVSSHMQIKALLIILQCSRLSAKK